MRKILIKELEWDEDFFGIPSGKIIINEPVEAKDILQSLEHINRSQFITIMNMKNDPKNNKTISSALGQNAFLADINVQLLKTEWNNTESINCSIIKDKCKLIELQNIARKGFSYSRFFNDPYISEEKKSEIYAHWVYTASLNKDKKYIVYTENNYIQGFLLFDDSNEKECHIDLIVVNSECKGRHIGTNMIRFLENYLVGKKSARLFVGTQINNIAALNFYQKNGFKINSVYSIYHYWRGNND